MKNIAQMDAEASRILRPILGGIEMPQGTHAKWMLIAFLAKASDDQRMFDYAMAGLQQLEATVPPAR